MGGIVQKNNSPDFRFAKVGIFVIGVQKAAGKTTACPHMLR